MMIAAPFWIQMGAAVVLFHRLAYSASSSSYTELEEELKECLFCLHRNEMMFDLEVDTDLIEQHIYERQALLARYRYLLGKARELGLHTILEKYQPLG